MKNKIIAISVVVLSLFALQVSSNAALLDFDLSWSGEELGNNATAMGTIVLNDSVLENPGLNSLLTTPGYITDFSITVAGASSGNGTFLLNDFDDIYSRQLQR